jgi:alanine racemase
VRSKMAHSESHAARPNHLEVDLGAIQHNVAQVRAVAGDARIFAAVKANAYGFGLEEVAEAILASGANALAMVDIPDAIRLRERGVDHPILIYAGNLVTKELVHAVEHYRVMPTLVDMDTSIGYSSFAVRPLEVFIKVDVGLERNGITADAAVDFVKSVRKLPRISIQGIYTHMHVPLHQAESESYIDWQYHRFMNVLEGLRENGIQIPIQMAASSSVIRSTTKMMLNAVDPGHLLYGLTPLGRENIRLNLRPAFSSLRTRLIQVKDVQRAEFVEQAPFRMDSVRRLGVIPFGRADGMVTVNSGVVLVHGQRAQILGAPSVEHTRIDLTNVPSAKAGDDVVIIGRQGGDEITLQQVMTHQKFDRDLAVALEVRESVPRTYLRDASVAAHARAELKVTGSE